MIKDIPKYKVEDIAIGISPRLDQDPTDDIELWDTFLINLKKEAIRFVLITAKSYGELGGSAKETQTFRYYVDKIQAETSVRIEPIMSTLFDMTTEYFLSFLYDDYLYEKKYIFVRGSISEEYFRKLPYTNREGVMIL